MRKKLFRRGAFHKFRGFSTSVRGEGFLSDPLDKSEARVTITTTTTLEAYLY